MIAAGTFVLVSLLLTDRDLGRPWADRTPLAREFASLEAAARSPDEIIAAARFGIDHGLLADTLKLARHVDAVGAPLADLLGLVAHDGRYVPAESQRYRADAPSQGDALAKPADRAVKQLLAGRFRDMKRVNQSTYFDLWSDLSADEIQPYTDDLNGFYRNLRNRFKANLLGSIDVYLYGSRSDYLISYARSFGRSGENVLGFYVPSLRRLVFYDDPYDREQIALTARHECTHLLVDLSFDGAPLPPWLNEGMACYMAAGGPAASGQYTAGLMFTLAREMRANKVGLVDLMKVTQDKLKYEHYAWSWALVHYLNAEPEREAAFQKFLDALRSAVSRESKPKDAASTTYQAFLDAFSGSEAQIEDSWWSWFEDDFRVERADQLVDCGKQALVLGRFSESDNRRYLDVATECFANAASSEALVERERRFGRLAALVARAEVEEYDLAATRLLLRALLAELPGVGELTDESQKADLIRRSLLLLRRAANTGEIGRIRDGLAKLAADDRGPDADTHRACLVLYDDLLRAGFDSLTSTLTAEPLHRPAAQQWLLLAHDCDARRVREVFDYLQFQVDRDPDDRNLAALGLAYVALDKPRYGKAILKRAIDRSPRPGALIGFAERAGVAIE